MKIFQLVTKRQYRGAEVSAAHLSKGLSEAGYQVYFIGLYTPPEHLLEVPGVTMVDLKMDRGFSLLGLFKFIKLLIDEKPDIIQANGSDTLKVALISKLLFQPVKLVYRNISLISEWMGARGVKRGIYRVAFKWVNQVVSVGTQSRMDFIKTIHYPPHLIRVIRRGIAEPVVVQGKQAIREELNTHQDAFVIIHIGSFSREKNQQFLLKVLKHLLIYKEEVVLWFLGNGPDKLSLERIVMESNLEKYVRFLGIKQDIGSYLAAADLNALCSTVEGVPGVAMEAGFMGLPTVAVDVGGVGEVVENHVTGLLVPTHDATLFFNAIVRLIEDSELRISLGVAMREKCKHLFSIENSVRDFINLYTELRTANFGDT